MNKKIFQDVIPVVIGSSYNAYGVLRSFYERGIKSILVTPEAGRCFVEYSKYCGRCVHCADPNWEPEQYIADLLALGKSLVPHRGMFFPTHDEQIFVLDAHRPELEAYFEFPYSSRDISIKLMDKAHLNALCQTMQIPTIKERLVSTYAQARACTEGMRFPLIVKLNMQNAAYIRELGSKIRIFWQETEYLQALAAFFEKVSDGALLVQEYIEDSDHLMPNVNCVSDRTGHILCAYATEKVRQYPLNTGTSTATRVMEPSLPQAALLRGYVEKLLTAVGYYGLSGTEFKYDSRTGEYKIIEINLRSEFPNYLQTLVGCNMPYLLYQYHLTGTYDPAEQTPGLRAMCYLPVTDYMYAVHLNKLKSNAGYMTKRAWKETITSPHTWYGLDRGDLKACIYALVITWLQTANAYLRIKLHIPETVSTKDFLRGKRNG